MRNVLLYTVCDICGRRFYGTPADHIEICGNCGNDRYFTPVWVEDVGMEGDYGQA